MVRKVLIAFAFATGALAIYGCATEDSQTIRRAAQAECRDRASPADHPTYDSVCMREVENNIRAARRYEAPPPPKQSSAKSKGKAKRND